jgi:hypothetical protein
LTGREIFENYLIPGFSQKYKFRLISIILSNLSNKEDKEIFEMVEKSFDIKNMITLLNEYASAEEPDERQMIDTIEFWLNCLNNERFRSKTVQNDTGLQLYDTITKINIKNSLAFTLEVKTLIIKLIIKLTIGFKENETALAKRIIEDLEDLQSKRNDESVNIEDIKAHMMYMHNSVLTPLLKAQDKIPVSFDFLNKKANSHVIFAFVGVNEQ